MISTVIVTGITAVAEIYPPRVGLGCRTEGFTCTPTVDKTHRRSKQKSEGNHCAYISVQIYGL